jgi:predicted GTPase
MLELLINSEENDEPKEEVKKSYMIVLDSPGHGDKNDENAKK